MTSLPHPSIELHESTPAASIPKMGMFVNQNLSQKGQSAADLNRAIIPGMGNELRRLRLERSWTIDRAAEKMGLSYGGYLKLERSERRLKAEQIARAAAAFDVSDAQVMGSNIAVYIVGEVLSLGLISLYSTATANLKLAPVPDGATKTTVAYIVKEGAVLPGIAEENWLIYHDELLSEVPDSWIGKLCVCQLIDGTKIVRRLYYGREAGKFDLVGVGSDITRGVGLQGVALVTWTRQR